MVLMICLALAGLLRGFADPSPAWRVGALAVDVESGDTLLRLNARELYRPASTVKLVTALLAFESLGPSRVLETPVLADFGSGTLYIEGSGASLLEQDDIERAAVEVAAVLGTSGGWDVLYDTGIFADSNRCPGWDPADWTRVYCPPVEAISLGDNVLEIVVSARGGTVRVETYPELPDLEIRGQITISASGQVSARPDGWDTSTPVVVLSGSIPRDSTRILYVPFAGAPAQVAALFASELAARGVGISSVRSGTVPEAAGLETLAVIRSRPVGSIVAQMNKWSLNVVAEELLRVSAAEAWDLPGSTALGCETAAAMVDRLCGADGAQLADGSGLSRLNRLSPAHLVAVLIAGATSEEWGPEFVASLAVNGVDGTLRSRLADLPAGAFRGKTGSLSDTAALAGLLRTRGGRTVALAFLTEIPQGAVVPARNWMDSVVRQLREDY